jgi:molybdate transport system substrate-binding protein
MRATEKNMADGVELKILSTTAMKTVFEQLAPAIERTTGNRLDVALGPSMQIEKRIDEGEAADLAIVSGGGVRGLVERGRIVTGSVVAIANSSIGVAVPKGAPRPDLSSVEGFKQALLDAKAVAMSKPVGGGQSGAHMAKVLAQLGIAEVMAPKSKYGAGGAGGLAGLVVLRGEADLGIQQMAELMAVDGIDVIGPLPPDIQMVTPFVAGIPANASHPDAAKAVIELLTTTEARRVLKTKGLDPA